MFEFSEMCCAFVIILCCMLRVFYGKNLQYYDNVVNFYCFKVEQKPKFFKVERDSFQPYFFAIFDDGTLHLNKGWSHF